jgi:hypothetical protein
MELYDNGSMFFELIQKMKEFCQCSGLSGHNQKGRHPLYARKDRGREDPVCPLI